MYHLFRVSLFYSDETFMCMHVQKVFFFSNMICKKPVTFLKNGCKKLFSLQNVMKNCVKRITLQKNCLQVPEMVTPPIKNNSPSLNGWAFGELVSLRGGAFHQPS